MVVFVVFLVFILLFVGEIVVSSLPRYIAAKWASSCYLTEETEKKQIETVYFDFLYLESNLHYNQSQVCLRTAT